MQTIKIDLNNKSTVVDLDSYIQVQQGDSALPVQFLFVSGTDTVDMSDGKLGFISGVTAGDHNIELEAPGNAAGQCVINLNSYLFQDAGAFKWLYVGIKDSSDNVIMAVNATLTVKASNLDNGINTGNYRSDWQKFKAGIDDDVQTLNSQASQASQTLAQFDGFMDSANSEVKSAATYATSATDTAVSQAKSAVDEMNNGVQTAISGMSENVTNELNSKMTQVNSHFTDDESKINNLMSPNLIYNSEFLTTLNGVDSYKLWSAADGWIISNLSGFVGQTADWYYNGSRDYNLKNAINDSDYVASQPVYFNGNVVSFSIAYNTWNNTNNPHFYLDFDTTFNMQDSTIKTVELSLPTPPGNANYVFFKQENINVPSGTHWVRLRITADVSSKLNFFISQPMLNVGATVLPYVSSSESTAFLEHKNLNDISLMNGASGAIKAQKLGNMVTLNLSVTNYAKNGTVVYQLPQQYQPTAQRVVQSWEINSDSLYVDNLTINTDGTIAIAQRGSDNSSVNTINMNGTFTYFI